MVDQAETELLLYGRGNVVQVFLVPAGQDDGGDTGPHRAEDLLLDTADRHDLPAQGDLAGHGQVVSYRTAREQGGQHRHERHAGGRAVLGNGAHGQMDVYVVPAEERRVDLPFLGVRPDVGHCGLGGLFHHVAQLAR